MKLILLALILHKFPTLKSTQIQPRVTCFFKRKSLAPKTPLDSSFCLHSLLRYPRVIPRTKEKATPCFVLLEVQVFIKSFGWVFLYHFSCVPLLKLYDFWKITPTFSGVADAECSGTRHWGVKSRRLQSLLCLHKKRVHLNISDTVAESLVTIAISFD
jgi:hypothetical protein